MRHLALPITVFAAMLLSVVSVSAATLTFGPPYGFGPEAVTSCPVTITPSIAMSLVGFPPQQGSSTIITVKSQWIRSDGVAVTPQTVNNVAASAAEVTSIYNGPPFNASGWIALQLVSPSITNNTSNHITFTLTCPTTVGGKKVAGSLTFPPVATLPNPLPIRQQGPIVPPIPPK
jgi:hypothetical protein